MRAFEDGECAHERPTAADDWRCRDISGSYSSGFQTLVSFLEETMTGELGRRRRRRVRLCVLRHHVASISRRCVRMQARQVLLLGTYWEPGT